MRDVLEVNLLGGVAVRRRGNPGNPTASRALGLLAYLALHAESPQSRPHLAGTFWPDSGEAQARTNLRRELHQLRAILDNVDCLVSDPQTLAWQDTADCRVDVRRFCIERLAALHAEGRADPAAVSRHAAAAIEEYKGPLLPGWYDDWVVEQRDALERQCIDLCDRGVAAARESRDHAQALFLARRRIQLAPLEELGYRQLMEIQALSGDRAGAMTTYHRCASLLEQELNVGPSEATTRAMSEVMGRSPVGATDSGAPGHLPLSVGTTLVGRERELRAVQARWERARAGEPGVLLLTGEAGVGKSRLVSELAMTAARHGAVVASARCFGTSERLALAPVADWLRSPQLRAAEPGLDNVFRAEVDRLVPRPAAHGGSPVASRAKVDAWQRVRFFEGLARAVLVVRRPVLLVLDDVQWCDNDTMLWLFFLLQLAQREPLLVAGTVREDELDDNPDVLASLRSLRSAGLVTAIPLGPLAAADTARIATEMLGRVMSDGDASVLQAATGGYPLYVVEAVQNLPADPAAADLSADNLSGVLQQRLANASAAGQQIAGLAAAVGRDFSLDLLIEASDEDGDSVVQAVDELWRRRILRQSGQGYDFSHDLLRDAAYLGVAPAQRWLHHRRLAQAIELLHSGRLDDVAAQLAHHYAFSGRADRALPFYVTAAEAAAKVFANAEAIRLLRLSLELLGRMPPGRDRDLRELNLLQSISAPLNALHGYADPRLEDTLTRSVALAESLGETHVQLASLVGLWASRIVQGDIVGSYRLASRALELSDVVPELAGQAHFAVAGSAVMLGDHEDAVRQFALARDLSVGAVSLAVGTRPEVHAQAWSAHARWLMGDTDGALLDSEQSIRRAREVKHPYTLAVALAYGALTHQMCGDLSALDDTLEELSELCARYDLAYYREWALVLSGWRDGGAEGIARMRTGLAHLTDEGALVRMPYWLSLLAEALTGAGDSEAARAALDAAQVAAVQRDERWWLPEVLRLSAAFQSPADARRTLQRAVDLAAAQSSPTLLRRCEVDLAEVGVRDPSYAGRTGDPRPERSPNA